MYRHLAQSILFSCICLIFSLFCADMRAHNIAKAMAVFRSSTLPGDDFHKQCWKRFTEQHKVLTPVFHMENQEQLMENNMKITPVNPKDILVDVIALSDKLCPYPIQANLAYATQENFVGRVVDGYMPSASKMCLLTRKAAQQLCLVQCALNKQGLSVFIFDALRPLRAVRDFSSWYDQPVVSEQEKQRKTLHYPHLEKTDLPRLGYAPMGVSRHCFGHAVDLSLVDITTGHLLDMGTIFDFFDATSHHPATPPDIIGEEAYHNRQLLAHAMSEFGFIAYSLEYWHFDYQEQELEEPVDLEITPDPMHLNVR